MSRRKTGQAQVRSKDQAADKLRDEVRIIENLGDVPNELIADSDSSPICKAVDE